MRFFFVRHGESEANLLHEFSNRGWKHPLTELGRDQARQLTETLFHELGGAPVHAIITSPLQRAVETAELLAARLHTPVQREPALREYDCGVLEGRRDDEAWAEYVAVQRAWLEEEDPAHAPAQGESFLDMQARFVPFIRNQLAQPRDGALILVSHGGLYRCMLPLVLANVDRAWAAQQAIPNTGVIQSVLRDGELICTDWCGVTPPRNSG